MGEHATTCPLDCPDACGAIVETDEAGRFTRLRGNPAHSWSRGVLCGKTAIYHELAASPERLRAPLVRSGAGFVEVSWERALGAVADGLARVRGEELLALHYAGHMGLVHRRYPLRVLNALGATDTDGTICDSASFEGYRLVLGHVVGPDLEDVVEADLLVLWGCDARRTVQHLMPRVQELCRRGVPVLVVDVYRTDTVEQVERWGGRGLIVEPGTDAALALGLVELAFERGHADLGFLREHCTGAAELRAEVAGRYPLAEVARITGLAPEEVSELADRLGRARRAWIKTGVGWNRRRNGGMGMRAVASMAVVYGHAERFHFESSDHFGIDESAIVQPWRRPAGAPEPVSQVGLGRELAAGRFRAAVVWGHNPAVTLPDSRRVREGLARDDLFLVVHELVMTETARHADVVLPATALPEHTDVYRSYGHRVMQVGRAAVAPPADQRSNVDAFRALAERLGLAEDVWAGVSEDALVEELLEANRARFTDDELARLRAGEPVKLAPRTFADRGTPSGRIELASEAERAQGRPAVAEYVQDDAAGGTGRFWLVSAPSVATHNSTYLRSRRHALRAGPPRFRIHPDDAAELGLSAGSGARLSNEQGSLTLAVELSEALARGVVSVDGFPDPELVPEGLSSNALTSGAVSDLGGGSVMYSAKVDVTPV